MRFRVVGPLTLESVVIPAPEHQGAPGLAHGGIVAAVFDEALGALQSFVQEPSVTASLTTDFRKPMPIGVPLHVVSRLDGRDGRKLRVSAEAHLGAADGPVAATAPGLLVPGPADHSSRHGRPEDVAAAAAAGAAPRPFAS
jgi:acyl-coenzyme A thioesterase PaaI-like protein